MDDLYIKKVEDLLLKYKYDNRSLEKTVKDIFSLNDIRENCINDKDKVKKVQELAYELVDYKFHRSSYNKKNLIRVITDWCIDNKEILNKVDNSALYKNLEDALNSILYMSGSGFQWP